MPNDTADLSRAGRTRRRLLFEWAAAFAFWHFFAVLYASQIYLGMRAEGMQHSFWRMLAWQLLGWSFLALLTPPVLWLGRRFPLARPRLARSLAVHVPACLALALAHTTFFTFLTMTIRPYDDLNRGRTFQDMLLGRLSSNFHLEILIYAAIIGVGYAVNYYDRYREREFRASQLEARLAEAQLQALRMQLHPHFLFNTLNGIAGLVRDSRNKEAVRMLAGLSDLLRHTLENAGRQEVPLREEMEFLELYLGIQQMRFPDRLKIETGIAPDALDALVPNLILQPLVENAVRHGVAARASGGTVGVRAAREEGLLRVEVYDDGPGLRRDWEERAGERVGLTNTRARLEQLYGEGQSFSVRDREGGGVEAVIRMPLRLLIGGARRNGRKCEDD